MNAPGTRPANGQLSLCTLASGSKGNSIYVSDGRTRLLVDAGVPAVELQRRMQAAGLDCAQLDGLLVSHEHADHIRGVGVLSRRFRLPVYLSRSTLAAAGQLGRLHRCHHFECGTPFRVNTLEVHPFSTSHDASDPAGFTIAANGKRLGIATDLGKATALVAEHLRGCALVVLEANHDPCMLEQGPYPWFLKQRIRSRHGHLSNHQCRALLSDIRHPQLRYVVLAHLSETNNHPQKALADVAPAIDGDQTRLLVAEQHCPGPLLRL